ncbi:hypothetical protein [Sphingobacterium sp.]|uniref:hypothetical protein n=1 Tax=Sphingobacterium sp. TaxID=341027 RepID=UPI002FDC7C6D
MKRLFIALLALLAAFYAGAQTKRYTNHNEFSVITYGPAFLESGFGLHTYHGLQFHENISLGLNTGLDRYPVNGEGSKWFLPLSAKVNYVEFPDRKRSFFAGLDLGYGFAFLNKNISEKNLKYEYQGGVLVNSQLGWRFKFKNSAKYWSLAAGYRYQQYSRKDSYIPPSASLPDTDPWYGKTQIDKKYDLHRFTLQIGVGF